MGRDVQRELREELRGEVAFDDYTRHPFSRDASMYSLMPLGVAFPRDTADVAAAVRVAARHGIPVTARGAGTSLAGQTTSEGLVLDLSRHLHTIVALDPEARRAVVQPGVVQDDLNRAAAPHGLMFGPDTSTSDRATIGGMIGNNSAGSGSVRYGMTIDHVRSLEVVLADGTVTRLGPLTAEELVSRAREPGLAGAIHRGLPAIVETHRAAIQEGFPPFWRRAGGYRLDRLIGGAGAADPFDLARFVVGAEGTLVVVTEAEVDLVPRPRHTVFAVGHFTGAQEAIAATTDALALDPAQVELIDRTILDFSRRSTEYAGLSTFLVGDPEALLFVSFAGDDLEALGAQAEQLARTWQEHGHGYATLRLPTPADQRALLKVRKAGLGLLMAASRGTSRPVAFVEDTAVPPEVLADYTARFRQVLDEEGLTAGFYGHASVGCLHVRPFVDVADPQQVARMRRVAVRVKDLVREFGGVNSSEHGDGLARSEFNREIYGDDLYEAMREVKALFDPAGTLNPGKIVDAPPMTEHLRDAALPPAPPLRTRLDFSVTGGMRGAADRCMNIGVCRKSGTGVMCPSYMATLQEEDSTRGRANALVKALSEADPKAALGDERLHEVLDLCLMCKACRSECPLGVDMAKLKSETLSHHHDVHGIPLRSRVFAGIRRLNALGSRTAAVANLAGRFGPGRRAVERALGITSRRPLPTFHATNLVRWFAQRRSGSGTGTGGAGRTGSTGSTGSTGGTAGAGVAGGAAGTGAVSTGSGTVHFLADSFTTFTEPRIGRAAVELLERAGWEVDLVSSGCCGRSALSKGLVDRARASAADLVSTLAAGPVGAPVVGCEPSCLFTLRDETLAMLPGDERAAAVAARVRQVEELLAEAVDSGALELAPDSWLAGRRILYHGHCHQKAEVGTAATVGLLRRIPGAEVVEVDAGCCGMAGSFGYEAEHYDISMQIGEDRLLPAVRAETSQTVVCATGTSCREQIFHGTGRSAWHPVELVREALVAGDGRPADRGPSDEQMR
ncbi:FAD-binding and (Fe-S)-binding domain-containing protein [Ornithinimicrobium pekingense]|uniref:Oxidoreductase n=1 Tax=Ornithinimicrobium pekingense TaxID=384677 RepID=A0ABQ2FE04_9MICO|nr:FAD-binding and (Fe-S)-binding domain-containing protein [Ornithinimicrobium pekingense]GGK79826.1 oxidoreductase [Ornithinimicrobium pekingense]